MIVDLFYYEPLPNIENDIDESLFMEYNLELRTNRSLKDTDLSMRRKLIFDLVKDEAKVNEIIDFKQ